MRSTRRLTAGQIAELVGGELIGNEEVVIAGVAPLDRAGPGDLSFLAFAKYLPAFRESRAGVVLVAPQFRGEVSGPATRIEVTSPHHALALVLPALTPAAPVVWGVHPTATVGVGTRWTGRIAIGLGVVVGRDVQFGTDCVLHPYAVIGHGTTLGDGCRIDAHAVVEGGAELGR